MIYYVIGNIGAGKTYYIENNISDENTIKIYEPITEYKKYLNSLYTGKVNNESIQTDLTYISNVHICKELMFCDLYNNDIYIESIPDLKDIVFRYAYNEYDIYTMRTKIYKLIKQKKYNIDNVIYVGQHLSINDLQNRIKKRGRDNEENIPCSVLKKLNEGYKLFYFNLI